MEMVQTEGKIIMPFTHLLDSFLIHYLERFNDACFCVKLHDKTYTIGEGEPLFTVNVKNDISKKELLASAELALGEAYMRGVSPSSRAISSQHSVFCFRISARMVLTAVRCQSSLT